MKRDQTISEFYQSPIFDTINGLEKTVREVDHLARAILLIAAGNDSPEWRPIHTIGGLLLDRAEEIEQARVDLFDLTHPLRDKWEKAGGKEKWQKRLTAPKRKAA